MSNNIPHSESELFEVLPGLQGTGPYPEQFTPTGKGMHHEGFVVRFHPPSAESWVGNFQGGLSSCRTAIAHPDGRTVIVVSDGQAYHVDPVSRSLLRHFGAMIADVIVDPAKASLLFLTAFVYGLWMHLVSVGRQSVSHGTASEIWWLRVSLLLGSFDPTNRDKPWCRFEVCLKTGTVKGGSYRCHR